MRIAEILINKQIEVYYRLNNKRKLKKKHRGEDLNFQDFDRMMKEGGVYKRCKGRALRQIK